MTLLYACWFRYTWHCLGANIKFCLLKVGQKQKQNKKGVGAFLLFKMQGWPIVWSFNNKYWPDSLTCCNINNELMISLKWTYSYSTSHKRLNTNKPSNQGRKCVAILARKIYFTENVYWIITLNKPPAIWAKPASRWQQNIKQKWMQAIHSKTHCKKI